jgi:hypothetical protein
MSKFNSIFKNNLQRVTHDFNILLFVTHDNIYYLPLTSFRKVFGVTAMEHAIHRMGNKRDKKFTNIHIVNFLSGLIVKKSS